MPNKPASRVTKATIDQLMSTSANKPDVNGPVPGHVIAPPPETIRGVPAFDSAATGVEATATALANPADNIPDDPDPAWARLSSDALASTSVTTAIAAIGISPDMFVRLAAIPFLSKLRVGHFVSQGFTHVYVDTLLPDDEHTKDLARAYATIALKLQDYGMSSVALGVAVFATDIPQSHFHKRSPVARVRRYIWRFQGGAR